jgi:hypothetical protein
MSRVCTICTHADRSEIDHSMLAGEPLRKIADRVSLSASSLFRHRTHIETYLVEATAASNAQAAINLAHKLAELSTRARRLADAAEQGGDLRTALGGVRELARILEMEGRVAGQIKDTQININLTDIKLDRSSSRDLSALISERLDGTQLNAFVEAILERFPWWDAEPGPPKPPDWILRWSNGYMLWKIRRAHRAIECGAD